ncbi:glycosyltransferase [Stenotrophomonas maltophilia]|uniref:glycosyltransferase family 2 protein n=1 Tax=Stenotrophomonas TaxID=40323 RepID=UPI0013D9757A|nr:MULTISPECIES: glycosyltransferase family 2 protein [Stenotrophomonas]ELC7323325.1 glycosyltransferase family 2 protein [Stenotrophomonas maltophilia]MBA0276667.1 glycosyltransferase [Stenotrophomonas maltophilia]MBA0413585.1 glycosyltransferase [Stenotrophomonas maltophilia]MBA0498772.1 glycosyltransferase [Stenotrophomonas maltophilia]MBA0502301.1 glycosyltransferase [Stenotrophomonas maltophilia]
MALISYVVPVYNNSGSLRPTWESIRDLFQTELADHTYEIVFVNDGSQDNSWAEIMELAAEDNAVRPFRFTRNFGQVPAIIGGYQKSAGDAVINISADLQDPIELTVQMVRNWEAGFDVVIGHRNDRNDSIASNFFSKVAYGILRSSNRNIPEGGFDFVLMSRRATNTFLQYEGRNRYFQGDILWAGYRTALLPYARRKRTIGKSQYNFGRKLKLFLDYVIDGSYLPIRLMSLSGVLVSALGLLYAVVVLGAWALHTTPFPGWAPLMIAGLVIGGMIMLMLGVIGEYLWRILDEVKHKPMYIFEDRPDA